MYKPIKRSLDLILATSSLILLSPLFLMVMIIIKLDSKGPILFTQKRVGKDKRHFNILKFRTMKVDAPKDMPTHQLEDPDRYITKWGRFLRKSSLDEIPQLINIIKGDMSFVGPRPALWNQDDLIEHRDLHNANSVLPGITGLAQVSGRDELPIPIKARLDGDYVKKMSFLFDVKLFIETFIVVFTRRGLKEGKHESD